MHYTVDFFRYYKVYFTIPIWLHARTRRTFALLGHFDRWALTQKFHLCFIANIISLPVIFKILFVVLISKGP